MSSSARGSVWDSRGMARVLNGYLRSWDSSQSRLWKPGEAAAPPSLAAGSGSTTDAAAMAVDQRRSAASVLRAVNPRTAAPLADSSPDQATESESRRFFPFTVFTWVEGVCAVPPPEGGGVYTPCWQQTNNDTDPESGEHLYQSRARTSNSDTYCTGGVHAPAVVIWLHR